MKKIIIFLISLILLFNATACTEIQIDVISSENHINEEPNLENCVSFDAYDEMLKWFTEQSYAREKMEKYENYKQMSDNIRKNGVVAIPTVDGNPETLRQAEGYEAIAVFAYERFNKPWIWYHCVSAAGEEYCICISYLTSEEQELANNKTYSEFLKVWKPSSANIHNASEHSDCYIGITEKQIELADKEISALSMKEIGFENGQTRKMNYFIYDDLLVYVWSFDDIFTDDFWSRIGFTDKALYDE